MSPLSCSEFDQLTDALIDARLPWADDRLREHANACARCRALWEENALLEEAIPVWKSTSDAVDLADTVLAKWAFETGARTAAPASAGWRRRVVWTVATSAAALVVAALVLQDRGQNEQAALPPGEEFAVLSPQEVERAVAAPDEIDVPPRGILREAGSAYLSLAEETGRSLADAAVLVPSAAGDVDLRRRSDTESATESRARRWGEGLSPIRDKVGKAAGFLLDVFPADPAPAT